MKIPIALITFVNISIFASTHAFSQTNPTAEAEDSSFATIIKPIEITNTEDSRFGNLISNSDGGTVIVSTAGVRTSSKIDFPTIGVTVSAATFEVSGFSDSAFSITFPTSSELESGAFSMDLNSFNHDAGTSPALDNSGNVTFNVGATLVVGADQEEGEYTSTFEVSVNYN